MERAAWQDESLPQWPLEPVQFLPTADSCRCGRNSRKKCLINGTSQTMIPRLPPCFCLKAQTGENASIDGEEHDGTGF